MVAVAALPASPAQEVRAIEWGFDGSAVPGRFNLLSVLVDNSTDRPLDTELILTRRTTLGGQLGAPIVRPCYVAPRSRRWLQFTPYVTSRRQPWDLQFGDPDLAGTAVPRPAEGAPALVLIDVGSREMALAYQIPIFAEDRFPSAVTATAGLGAVVMDRQPDWERARRQAFVDWLRGGGVVHLLRGFRGWPRFTAELEVLNGSDPVQRVGQGLVVRHEFRREVLQQGIPEALKVDAPPARDLIEGAVTSGLQSRIEVQHDWLLINLMAIVYVAVVGPVVFRIAARGAAWTRVLGVLVVVIGLACLGFSAAGARGVGERALLYSLSYARPLDAGRWDVVQYANAFVTDGGEYTVAADGEHDVFATAQVHEPVRGSITEGVGARLVFDLPQFSWRSFVHRRVVRAPSLEVELLTGPWSSSRGGPVIEVAHGPASPARRVLGGLCVFRERVWTMRIDGQRLRASASALPLTRLGDSAEAFAPILAADAASAHRALSAALAEVLLAVVADRLTPGSPRHRPDRVVVLLLVEPGEEFAVRAEGLGTEQGLALLRFDLDVGQEGR